MGHARVAELQQGLGRMATGLGLRRPQRTAGAGSQLGGGGVGQWRRSSTADDQDREIETGRESGAGVGDRDWGSRAAMEIVRAGEVVGRRRRR